MTPTETLRAMLDERGVEWKAPASYDGSTKYDTIVDGYWFHEYNGKITVHGLTPEQAITSTLGHGECHNLKASWPSLFKCDECGYSNDDTYCGSECHFKFCPNCGAKVVDA